MIFKAYDIRGTAGKDLTPEVAELVGRAFGSEMHERGFKEVIVGRDNRLSSPELAGTFMSGVRAAGLDTIEIGEVATPVLYHASVKNGGCPAMMVTGSHLPPDRNGFKMTCGTTPFFGDDIQGLRLRIERNEFTSGSGSHRVDEHASLRYLHDLQSRFFPQEKTMKLVVDAGNGMAGKYAPALLHHMGHEVIELYTDSDGTYPNHPADPFEEENLVDAKGMVMVHNADLGLAFDGDADRLGMIDHLGYAHATDRLMIPLIWDTLKRLPGATIILDPLVSKVTVEMIKASGGVPIIWKSGHSNIKSKMKELDAPLAIETSGHVFVGDRYYGYDDGIYVGLKMVEILGRPGTAPLAEIMAEVPRLFTTPQYRPGIPENRKTAVIEAVRQYYANEDISTVDGVRVTLPHGWFIIRPSNTEQKLSIRFEGESEAALEAIIADVRQVLAAQGINLDE